MNKTKSKGEGFKCFNLCNELYRGVVYKGYNTPTPIQYETIPLIICGRDVVAMAPTGSGKTAAYLIPLFEKLKVPLCGESASTGARALIISPTRELALQIVKFATELGRFMNLKAAVLLGGESLEDDFQAIHGNPDIIIATPARLLHVGVEMGSKFNMSDIEYVVFDEGDRLFELGLVEQLTETINRLPKSRQTVIFSATLPGNLVEFAKAGMNNPKLIRLGLNRRLSDNLKLSFIYCSNDTKLAVLLELLSQKVDPIDQVIVFFATCHHVEYVSEVFNHYGLSHVVLYGTMDNELRKINTEKFFKGDSRILLCTDIAARGIDIPELAHMINFNFPDKPKLFQHRVGRVARAGRSGTAISLVEYSELPYVIDTFMYFSKPFKMIDEMDMTLETAQAHGYIGSVPDFAVTETLRAIETLIKDDTAIGRCYEKVNMAMQKYSKTKVLASKESKNRSKLFRDAIDSMKHHPLFRNTNLVSDIQQQFREILKRNRDTNSEINRGRKAITNEALQSLREINEKRDKLRVKKIVQDTSEFLSSKSRSAESTNYYVPYLNGPDATEAGLSLQNSGFAQEAKESILELHNDEMQSALHPAGFKKQRMMWDRKRKKFVGDNRNDKVKKIRTESGAVISASYKTDAYNKWLKTNNTGMIAAKTVSFDDDDDRPSRNEKPKKFNKKSISSNNQNRKSFQLLNTGRNKYKTPSNRPMQMQDEKGTRDLKPEQIRRKMKEKQKVKDFQKERRNINMKKKRNKK